jgi:hypothetical protein
VDHCWDLLSEGGEAQAQQCGWLKDKYGVSWQIVPRLLLELAREPHSERTERLHEPILKMKKPIIDGPRQAYEGWWMACILLPAFTPKPSRKAHGETACSPKPRPGR